MIAMDGRYIEVPRAGTIWEHYRGEFYEVLLIASRESDQKQMVVYQGAATGIRWVWSLEEWLAEITPGVFRFTYVTG
jgi:hypothetical protein